MNQLEYIPGRGGEKSIPMDGPSAFVGTADKLRSRKWQYDLGYRGLLNATRPAREVSIDFVSDYETADALRRVADADVAARTPGTFLAQGEWRQNAYIVESEPSDIHYGWLSTTLKALLLDGAWWRIAKKSFRPENSIIDKQYIVKSGTTVSATGAADAPLNALTVYGKAYQANKPKNGASVPIDVVQPVNLFETPVNAYMTGSASDMQLATSGSGGGTSFVAKVDTNTTYTVTSYLFQDANRFRVCLFDTDPREHLNVKYYPDHFQSIVVENNPQSVETATFNSGSFEWVCLGMSTSSVAYNANAQAQLEKGSTASPYVPYGCIGLNVDGNITPIDLDGNFLASLTDGTQDVIRVNSAGAVTLEKRVGVVDLNSVTWGMTGSGPYYYRSNPQSTLKKTTNATGAPTLLAEKFVAAKLQEIESQSSTSTYVIGNSWTTTQVFFEAKTDGSNVMNKPTGLCYYPLKEPQTITLDSIAMPQLTNYSQISIVASYPVNISAKYETSPNVFLDYPHDYEYDYLARSAAAEVETESLTPCDVRIIIYGQCDSPYIVIGENRYEVDCSVPAGAYLTIDGREKTIVLTLEDGTTLNKFGDGVRGSGLGGGQYVFEPIPSGAQSVEWDGSFGFDLGWYEEEGEPPWNQS